MIENFEDCELSTTDHGIDTENNVGECSDGPNRDSVGEDFVVEGSVGKSWFSIGGSVKFTFSQPVTAAGLVYVDGGGSISFRAFGPGDVEIGSTDGSFMLDNAPNGSTDDDHFFGAKSSGGITAIEIVTANPVEVDHVQYGNMDMLSATWDDGQSIESSSGDITAALWAGLQISGGAAPTVESPDGNTVALTYTGLSPNEMLQINLASYGFPFYPPDPVDVSGNQIIVRLSDNGVMRTLLIDISSSSAGTIDPSTVNAINTNSPPSASTFAFDPQAETEAESLAVLAALTGGSGSVGETEIVLTLSIVDDTMTSLPLTTVALAVRSVPSSGLAGLVILAFALAGLGYAR